MRLRGTNVSICASAIGNVARLHLWARCNRSDRLVAGTRTLGSSANPPSFTEAGAKQRTGDRLFVHPLRGAAWVFGAIENSGFVPACQRTRWTDPYSGWSVTRGGQRTAVGSARTATEYHPGISLAVQGGSSQSGGALQTGDGARIAHFGNRQRQ